MEKELTCLRSIIADCDERITAALKNQNGMYRRHHYIQKRKRSARFAAGAGEKAAGTGCR